MRLSDMRRPRPAANGGTAQNKAQRSHYTRIIREFVGCVALGSFIGVIIGSSIIGMADSQRLAASKMRHTATMAEVSR